MRRTRNLRKSSPFRVRGWFATRLAKFSSETIVLKPEKQISSRNIAPVELDKERQNT